MATWEDGPEYAPLARPTEFTSPAAAPLEQAPPVVPATAAAPAERPAFTDPPVPVASLASLVPVVADIRDPAVPFDVVTSNLTSGSAWGSAHGGPPMMAPAPGAPAPAAPAALPATAYTPEALLPPPPTAPQQWPAPAPVPGGYPPQVPGAFPAPGTPQWFGPGPYGEPPPARPVDARRVLDAATPGLLLVLGIGAVIFVLSPVMLAVAFALRTRVQAAQQQVRRVLGGALALAVTLGLLGLARQPLGFSEWWSFVGLWALLICWATLILVAALVYRALKQDPTAPPPSYPNPWR